MARDIALPRLSDTTDEGMLVTWFVEPGQHVHAGDTIAEIQLEKVSYDVPAPASGIIEQLLAAAGDIVTIDTAIATMRDDGEAASDIPADPLAIQATKDSVAAAEAGTRVAASPAARRLARELGVDLARVTGTGPEGRIQEADVQATAAGPGGGTPTPPPAEPRDVGLLPISLMRRTIAERLTSALAETAQLTLSSEADVTELAARLEAWTTASGRKTGWTEAVVRACAVALVQHPRLGMAWTDRGLVPPRSIDIGVAVALEDGLQVPVIRGADRKDVGAIGVEIAGFADRARSGVLTGAETSGACFTVTSLGAWRIDAFTPLLDPPQSAILGVGRARWRPAVVDGDVVPRMLLVLSLTFDHRVTDGAPAAAFLDTVVGLLERPARLDV